MANEICYWDNDEKIQKVRDATAEELAVIAQRAVDKAASEELARATARSRANVDVRSETDISHLRKELNKHLSEDDPINAIRTLDKIYQLERPKEV